MLGDKISLPTKPLVLQKENKVLDNFNKKSS